MYATMLTQQFLTLGSELHKAIPKKAGRISYFIFLLGMHKVYFLELFGGTECSGNGDCCLSASDKNSNPAVINIDFCDTIFGVWIRIRVNK
jgi:hypothetical protein